MKYYNERKLNELEKWLLKMREEKSKAEAEKKEPEESENKNER